jgi:RsiW-degrading membrane proteinase PrsW (M82 family)
MNPLNFIGQPDWRSALLAILFAAPWFLLLVRKRIRLPWIWVVLIAGIVMFPLSIAYIQVPIQNAINTLYARNLSSEIIQKYLLLLGIPIIIVSGLVQETTKFIIAVIGQRGSHDEKTGRSGLAFGAASGAGYGGMEAFWVFNQILATGITLATVQLLGIGTLLGFIERVFTVMLHIGAAALSTYGYSTGRPWRYLLLAIFLHSLTNYFVLPLQAGLLSKEMVEGAIAVIAIVTIGSALWLYGHSKGTDIPPAESTPQAQIDI